MAEVTTVVRTEAIVQKEMETAFTSKIKDWKLISKLSSELAKLQAAKEQELKDAKLKALAGLTEKVKQAIDKAVQKFVDDKSLDAADGIWYARDFGEKLVEVRLMKSVPRKRGEGKGTGSYVSRPEKTADLLAQVGSHVMFKEATAVTIDKIEQTLKAGTTFQQAYDHSNNGGWRNRVRMALLKEARLI